VELDPVKLHFDLLEVEDALVAVVWILILVLVGRIDLEVAELVPEVEEVAGPGVKQGQLKLISTGRR
jgi:hypothetical protein